MIRFERMTADHARLINPQASQNDMTEDERVAQLMIASVQPGDVWSFFSEEQLVGIAGIHPIWDGRASIWMLMDQDAGRHLLALTRCVRLMLEEYGYRRTELWVSTTFEQGCRWARLLGFDLETPVPARGYLPNGNDAYLYARVV